MQHHASSAATLPKRNARFAFLMAILFAVCGCAITPVRNEPLDRVNLSKGYRLSNLEGAERNSDSLFVILTFSGGGTRAASLAYGVLEVLRDTPITWEGVEKSLLQEVDVISSVSGGSLPAAYYGLFDDRIFEDFPDKVLYEDIQGSLIRQLLTPGKNLRLLSPMYTRTDIMAERFGDRIFANKTYADLCNRDQRPFIILNATDIASGMRFEFTQFQFDHLYSDLDSFPVGHAVAASAAFPGAFPPMTLRNYAADLDNGLPARIQEALTSADEEGPALYDARQLQRYQDPNRPYIHLSDGGVADNLGLLPVIRMLRREIGDAAPETNPRVEGVEKILIVAVNAETKPERSWDARKSPLGFVATLLAAGIAPLSNFTNAEVEYLRLLIENYELRGLLNGEGAGAPRCWFTEVSFDRLEDDERRSALHNLPTSFKLKRDQVDMLRDAARDVLAGDEDFQAFLAGLQRGDAR